MTSHPYLLRRADIEALEPLRKVHMLSDEAVRQNLSLGDRTGLTGLGVHIIDVAPGDKSTEEHTHVYEDEAVYVLSGRGEVRIGERAFEIAAGDFLGFPKGGDAHALYNTSDAVLRCLVIGERLAHDIVDYPNKQKRLFRNDGQPWNVVDWSDIAEVDAGRKV